MQRSHRTCVSLCKVVFWPYFTKKNTKHGRRWSMVITALKGVVMCLIVIFIYDQDGEMFMVLSGQGVCYEEKKKRKKRQMVQKPNA